MTRLQLALDEPDLEVSVARGRELIDLVEIIEVGTPLVIEYGMESVRRIREACPGVEVLADLKVMDAAAVSLARENNIPILVFSIQNAGAFVDVAKGRGTYTIIS